MERAQELIAGVVDGRAADLADEDGRPLGELASSRYDAVATEVVTCPYAGARRGMPMNQSALRQLKACWPELVGSMAWLAGPEPTVSRAWWASVAAISAPLRLPAEQPVPRVLSALYKTSLGFTQVLTAILLADDTADLPLASLGDAPAFLDFLDQGRWLVGDVQACAGPPSHVAQLFDALAGHAEPAPAEALLALGPPADYADAAALVVALQCAAIGAGYQAMRRGDTDGLAGTALQTWLTKPKQPCLRAMLSVPDRQPEAALRLYPPGQAPAALVAFLAAGPASPKAIQARFDAAVAALAPATLATTERIGAATQPAASTSHRTASGAPGRAGGRPV